MDWKNFQKWFEVQAASGVDYIVRILLKYDHEYKYRKVTALLLAEDDHTHAWNFDWHEGESDVIVTACVPVSNDIDLPLLEFTVI